MELFSSNIKKFLLFSYISGNGILPLPPKKSLYLRKRKVYKPSHILGNGTFMPKLEKIIKNPPRKNSLNFEKLNFLALILKKLLYFRNPKKIPHIFGK